MGSFLSEPVVEKVSSDEQNDNLKCGSSSMQGWRVSQEDAHNVFLDYDNNTSFFAVYDGHGGEEVALYCSQNLPSYIKNTEAYKSGDIEKALVDGFLGFDATIATEEVIAVLKELASEKGEESDEENIDNLYKEAAMPIEQVIEKYTNLGTNRTLKKSSEKVKANNEKSDQEVASSSVASSSSDVKSTSSSAEDSDGVSSSSNASKAEPSQTESVKSEIKNGEEVSEAVKPTLPDSSDSVVTGSKAEPSQQNGEVEISSSQQENGQVSKKGKAKLSPVSQKKRSLPVRNANQLYKNLLECDSEESEEDEEDKTFEEPREASSDDEDDGVNVAIEAEDSEEEFSAEEEEEEDDVDDDDDDFLTNRLKEEPGSDSGCTAVVALLKGNELFVANAGDSRCVVCRNGKAVEMSFDHKPEDEPEKERILKAGGRVSADGRVNNGLNLSRAIGDHSYKQNKELSDREQMITALPDIKKLTINPTEDEFMVLACDGIWNFMSSQEVVDFVRPRIGTCEKLSHICEEMFDHCLAPDTLGDGTGCDNMTAIIVQFKQSSRKRSTSPQPDETSAKRAKTEPESSVDTTA